MNSLMNTKSQIILRQCEQLTNQNNNAKVSVFLFAELTQPSNEIIFNRQQCQD